MHKKPFNTAITDLVTNALAQKYQSVSFAFQFVRQIFCSLLRSDSFLRAGISAYCILLNLSVLIFRMAVQLKQLQNKL